LRGYRERSLVSRDTSRTSSATSFFDLRQAMSAADCLIRSNCFKQLTRQFQLAPVRSTNYLILT